MHCDLVLNYRHARSPVFGRTELRGTLADLLLRGRTWLQEAHWGCDLGLYLSLFGSPIHPEVFIWHEVSSFSPLVPSSMTFLPWSLPTITETSETTSPNKTLILSSWWWALCFSDRNVNKTACIEIKCTHTQTYKRTHIHALNLFSYLSQ